MHSYLNIYNMHSYFSNDYSFITGPWQPCQGDTCGAEGRTSRNVTCLDTHSNAVIADTYCEDQPRPPYHTRCLLVCDLHRYQYRWQSTEWSTCTPRYNKRRCDEDFGIQYRNVTCVSKCGDKALDESFCSNFENKPITMQLCDFNCPRDCVMSDFDSWSGCSSCFVTHQSKQRTILAKSQNGGKPCRDWSDTVTCQRDSTCFELRMSNFKYKLGEWSVCERFKQGAVSRDIARYNGTLGLQKRSVVCTNVSGLQADEM